MNWAARADLVRSQDLTLGTFADRLAAVHRQRLAVTEPGRGERRFDEVAARVDGLARAVVAGGVAPGDRVVVATPNGYDQLLACLAVCRAGALAVPVNPRLRPGELDHVVTDCDARLVVRDAEDLLAGAEPAAEGWVAPEIDPDQVAAIFYTSGTTGTPKGARLTHRAILGHIGAAALWPSMLRHDEAVVALPVAHIMGFSVLLTLAAAGIPAYCMERFDAPAVLDTIETRRSTIFVGVPAMYRLLLEAGAAERDLTSIRVWASGADVMPGDLARRFQRLGRAATLPLIGASVGEAAFVEGYGMVETAGGVAARLSPPAPRVSLMPARLRGALGLDRVLGLPLPPNRFRVVDPDGGDVRLGQVGELWVKGPGVLEGYHGDGTATAGVRTADGWLRTGDLVRRGPFGIVGFAGRAKDVIKSGGFSVYAVELERALEAHPAVVEAAAVGLPDDRLGAVPAIAVVVHDGAVVTEEELLDFARARLSGYKTPRTVRIVAALPRTGTDKVAKRDVVAMVGGGHE